MAQELDDDALCDLVMTNFDQSPQGQQSRTQRQPQQSQPGQSRPQQSQPGQSQPQQNQPLMLPQEPVPFQGFSASQLPMGMLGKF